MENSSSSSSNYYYYSSSQSQVAPQAEEKMALPFLSSLHSVRKPPAKPWKKPSHQQPAPPKVYSVDPRGFRQLVQRLTGAPPGSSAATAAPPRRLRDAAPAPLELAPRQQKQQVAQMPVRQVPQEKQLMPASTNFSQNESAGRSYGVEQPDQTAKEASGYPSPGGLMGLLSPSLLSAYTNWCSFPVLSPGMMTPLEQNPVL